MSFLQIVKEMISQRGYRITEEKDNYLIGENKENQTVCVIKSVIDKLNVDMFQQCIGQLNTLMTKHGILMYSKITHPTKNHIIKLQQLGYKIEIFEESELVFNPTKHVLVPEHTKLGTDELKELKQKITIAKLPTILKTDAIAKFYGFEKGDVIKIKRKSGIIMYRVVR